ncbi:solute carrier family 45 member 3 [Chanos chanos]|uniref:Solute carrier family 45 member 3 n=1 Tax=Chanos chanos TaxID=29144 RepID=A0A6J2VQ77_CHACN|nr:solute carrier family 45 member 3-like [Chanos chanos]
MRGRTIQLLLISALTCGLELCMAAGTIYVPPMLLQNGLEERFMTMVLGVGPVLGLIFVPLIGSTSDGWHGRFGRRRPFIWALCSGVLIGLLLISQAPRLAALLTQFYPYGLKVPLLVAAICLFQFCGQACFTLLEALVSDLYPGAEESRMAFSVYTLMLSVGACIGYLLSTVNWSTQPTAIYLGGQEAFIYSLLAFVIIVSLISTAFVYEENARGVGTGEEGSKRAPIMLSRLCCHYSLLRPQFFRRVLNSCLSVLPQLYRLFHRMPYAIWKLFVAELCGWMALMTFELFYTDFVGEGLYGGVPSAEPNSPERLRYDEGVRMASLGLFLQCVTSVAFSLLMNRLVAWAGARTVYVSSMVLLVICTGVMTVSYNIVLVTVMAAATGYTFCILQTVPYILTCLYHSDEQVFMFRNKLTLPTCNGDLKVQKSSSTASSVKSESNGHPGGMPGEVPSSVVSSAPLQSINVPHPIDTDSKSPQHSRGIGLDIAILDSAYLLSQVLPSLLMGSIVHFFHSVTAYMACATGLSLLAVYFSSKVIYDKVDIERSC